MKLRRDVRVTQMVSAAVQVDAELSNGGTYHVSVGLFGKSTNTLA